MMGSGCVMDPDEDNNYDYVENEPYMHFLPVIYRYRNVPDGPDLEVTWIEANTCSVDVWIRNRGPGAVNEPFEIDVYIYQHNDQSYREPRAANEIWTDVAPFGAVFRVEGDDLPIPAGGTMHVGTSTGHWEPNLSFVDWEGYATATNLALRGGHVYAQVDSFGYNSYAAVLEGHEVVDGYYNNIFPAVRGAIHFQRGGCIDP
jgi:hypothetical protein